MSHIIEALLVAETLSAVVYFFVTFYDSAYQTLKDGKTKNPELIGWTIATFVFVMLVALFGAG